MIHWPVEKITEIMLSHILHSLNWLSRVITLTFLPMIHHRVLDHKLDIEYFIHFAIALRFPPYMSAILWVIEDSDNWQLWNDFKFPEKDIYPGIFDWNRMGRGETSIKPLNFRRQQ